MCAASACGWTRWGEEVPGLEPALAPLRALIADYRLDAFVAALDAMARAEAA